MNADDFRLRRDVTDPYVLIDSVTGEEVVFSTDRDYISQIMAAVETVGDEIDIAEAWRIVQPKLEVWFDGFDTLANNREYTGCSEATHIESALETQAVTITRGSHKGCVAVPSEIVDRISKLCADLKQSYDDYPAAYFPD